MVLTLIPLSLPLQTAPCRSSACTSTQQTTISSSQQATTTLPACWTSASSPQVGGGRALVLHSAGSPGMATGCVFAACCAPLLSS